ncbi:hypothetical protein HELRODRAFT_165069 [Helobdella robusta]|uniref:Endonuclease/exonuclease/phosphatase domain-containing protein n=1 Tax=Helobdella robusta TaxID=6412 RepID=T1EW89_HELRO|nr:hypothetical protein HELRODRAFT_165069 [Helobdella robusta]ESN92932.1 hypothetical protein HELRODRAFT_165069 [Helobdella robusta]
MFRLAEETTGNDKIAVMKILKHLLDEVVDTDITRLARLGKKSDGVARPLLICFEDIKIKNTIMKNLFKMKSLDATLRHVGLNHELTIEQRKEIKTLTDEAKLKENSDKEEKNGDENINDSERKTSGRKIKDFDQKDEKLRLGLLNIRSIIKKSDDVNEIIRDKIDVLILTETWHRSHDEISVLSAKPAEYSYVDYLRPYDANHGGLIIYFRSIFKFRKLELSQLNTFEAIAIKIICNRNDYLFLAIYRPGSLPVTPMFFKELSSVLESMTILTSNLVVAGDFNVRVDRRDSPHTLTV